MRYINVIPWKYGYLSFAASFIMVSQLRHTQTEKNWEMLKNYYVVSTDTTYTKKHEFKQFYIYIIPI